MPQILKIFSAALILLEIAFAIAISLSIFTATSSLSGSLTPEGGKEPIKFETIPDLATGTTTITATATGRNRGVLDIVMTMSLKILAPDNATITQGSDSKLIPAGSNAEFSIPMHISKDDTIKYGLGLAKPTHVFTFECRTFFNLTGMTLEVRV
jgi:hypothetical protein